MKITVAISGASGANLGLNFVKKIPDTNDFSYHALVRHGEKIESREFSGKEYYKLVKAGNIDLRKAQ